MTKCLTSGRELTEVNSLTWTSRRRRITDFQKPMLKIRTLSLINIPTLQQHTALKKTHLFCPQTDYHTSLSNFFSILGLLYFSGF